MEAYIKKSVANLKITHPVWFIGTILLILPILFFGISQMKSINKKFGVIKKIFTPDFTETINLALDDNVATLDPGKANDSISSRVVNNMYDQLYTYEYNKIPYSIVPDLAEGYPKSDISEKNYIIKIKKGIFYSQNHCMKKREVKANDFVMAVKRIAQAGDKSIAWGLIVNKIKGFETFAVNLKKSPDIFFTEEIPGFKDLADNTLSIRLNNKFPQIVNILAMPIFSPIPAEILKCKDFSFEEESAGTSEFVLEKNTPGDSIILKRTKKTKNSFAPKVINKVIFQIIPDKEKQISLFKEKKLDLIFYNTDESFTYSKPSLSLWYLAFNMKDDLILNSKSIRDVFYYLINKEKIVKILNGTKEQMASHTLPYGILGRKEVDVQNIFSIEKAKNILASKGNEKGIGIQDIYLDYRKTDQTAIAIASDIVENAKHVGINVIPRGNSMTEFLNKLENKKFSMIISNWIFDYPDAENIYQLLYSKNINSGINESSFENKDYDKLFEELSTLSANSVRRFKIIEELENIITKQKPWVRGIYGNYSISPQKWISNFPINEIQTDFLDEIRIDKELKKASIIEK